MVEAPGRKNDARPENQAENGGEQDAFAGGERILIHG
jgi:hypothetical protein